MSSGQGPESKDAFAEEEWALQRYLAAPPFWLRFPETIEREFAQQGSACRLKRFMRALQGALAAYLLLTAGDVLLSPDTAATTLPVRLAVLLATAFCGFYVMRRPEVAPHREWLMAALIAILAASQVWIATQIHPAVAGLYEGALILALLLCNQMARVRFRFAAPFSALWLILYFAQAAALPGMTPTALVLDMLFAGLIAAMSLAAKRTMELDNRSTHALKRLNAISAHKLELANVGLNAQARFDPLTGLANRREFDAYFERMHLNACRSATPISVIFIDVDYFKRFNDHYGHTAGDDCLCLIASLIRFAGRRPLDMVARYGGEEFILLLPETGADNARQVAEELRHLVDSTRHPHAGSPLQHLTISVGVAGRVPLPGEACSALLEAADRAVYAAKASGRNRVECEGCLSSAPVPA